MADRPISPTLDELRVVVQPPEVLNRRNAEHWAGALYLRRWSLPLTWLFVRLGLSANAATWAMIAVGLIGALVLTVPTWWAVLVCAVLMQAQVWIDCSDGEVARWWGTSSAKGIYLDRIGHYATEAALPIALGVHVDGGLDDVGWFTLLGALTSVVVVLNKAFGDLIHVARTLGKLPVMRDDGALSAPTGRRLGGVRQALRFVPFFRAFVAIEFSLLALAVASIAAVTGELGVLEWSMRVLPVLALVVGGGHLVAILASRRLVS